MMSPQTAMIVGSAYAVMSALTAIAYAIDKRRAIHGQWRLPEKQLHLLELLGGWPGALLAQRLFRHKRRKFSYVLVLGTIIALHLAVWVWMAMRAQG